MEIWPREELLARGVTRRQLTQLVDSGQLRRPIRGWYAGRGADERVLRAMQGHARVGCLTGAAMHGLWVPPHQGVHVVRPSGWTGEHLPDHYRVHTHPVNAAEPMCSVLECLAQIVAHHDAETALIVLESAAAKRAVQRGQLLQLIREAPAKSAQGLSLFSDRAESGGETRVRLHLRNRGVRVRAQAQIPGVGRVDLLVGERLIIEIDSTEHHATVSQYHEDRHRDLAAARLGFQTVRLTWHQVFLDWDATRAHLSDLLRRRQHDRAPRPGAEIWLPPMQSCGWLAG